MKKYDQYFSLVKSFAYNVLRRTTVSYICAQFSKIETIYLLT